ncbi:uncharacterized protein [Agelaius tricolor]|uniref:uncharacterized protein isoform X3 n=1 Tax=Agelaius tricolor TaxID=9191 RepID=UPI0039F2449B
MRMRMRMKMRLAFLLLMAAASCLSQTRHDPGEDSRQNSRDSSRDSRRDSRDSSRDSPRNSTRDSRRDLRDSPQDSPRDSPQDSPRGSPRGSRRGSGTAAAPRLLPAPLLLRLPPEPGPPRIRCLAPRRFAGSTFELLRGLPAVPVRSLPAAPDRHWAEFALPGAAGCFRCRYRSHNGSAWLESELSPGTGGSGGCGETPGGSPSRIPGPARSRIRGFSPQIWAMLNVSRAPASPRHPHPRQRPRGTAPGPCRTAPGPCRTILPGSSRSRSVSPSRGCCCCWGLQPRPGEASGGGVDRAPRYRPRASPWPPRRRRRPREGSR